MIVLYIEMKEKGKQQCWNQHVPVWVRCFIILWEVWEPTGEETSLFIREQFQMAPYMIGLCSKVVDNIGNRVPFRVQTWPLCDGPHWLSMGVRVGWNPQSKHIASWVWGSETLRAMAGMSQNTTTVAGQETPPFTPVHTTITTPSHTRGNNAQGCQSHWFLPSDVIHQGP